MSDRPAQPPRPQVSDYRFAGPMPTPEEMSGDLERWFWAHKGPIVHKWLHYFPLYERYFAPYRGRPLKFLEIGVGKGGSLAMWRDYFGPEVVLYGIDINPKCAEYDGDYGQVRIGSQTDPRFLRQVIEEMGGVDVILDDGSHNSRHIRASLDVLFPLLNDGGVYMIEDLHAAYWASHAGGYGHPEGFMATAKTLIDDLHHWYHTNGQHMQATKDCLAGMHVHDSIVVLDKARARRPAVVRRGKDAPEA